MHAETRACDEPESERQPNNAVLSDDRRPDRLGRYVVLDEIGRGGMGLVWTVYDPKLDRKVALKLLKGPMRAGRRQARFIREAQALAKLTHPNIITVHDVDTHEGRLYMAMELVNGVTLRKWLETPRQWREIVEVFVEAGKGLAAAHAAGITHRDFKPSNVLIAVDGRVKVADFGLAKHADHVGKEDGSMEVSARDDPPASASSSSILPSSSNSSRSSISATSRRDSDIMEVVELSASNLTQVGRIVGTPGYMAPEQYGSLDPHEVGAGADQFCLGVALYEALFGRLPFAGDNAFERYQNIRAGRILEPSDTSVPVWLTRVVSRTLQYDPAERYPSMEALAAALRDDPARRRGRWVSRLAGVGFAGLGALGVFQAMGHSDAPAPPAPCQEASSRMAEVWNPEVREQLGRVLGDSGRPFAADTVRRVTDRMDAYATTWIQQHTAVCEATRVAGDQSERLLDVRMSCLDRRRDELGALIGVLSEPNEAAVINAVEAFDGQRRPEPCASAQPGVESEVPLDPVRRAMFIDLRAQVDRARAAMWAGQHTVASDLAATVGLQARDAGFQRLLALALITEGKSLQRLGQLEAARQRLEEGIAIASETGDVRAEVTALTDLLHLVGVHQRDAEQAKVWQVVAENALRRAGSSEDLE
nr:serine/threonine protein kinase [Deltaproteobacteria bacterium]